MFVQGTDISVTCRIDGKMIQGLLNNFAGTISNLSYIVHVITPKSKFRQLVSLVPSADVLYDLAGNLESALVQYTLNTGPDNYSLYTPTDSKYLSGIYQTAIFIKHSLDPTDSMFCADTRYIYVANEVVTISTNASLDTYALSWW